MENGQLLINTRSDSKFDVDSLTLLPALAFVCGPPPEQHGSRLAVAVGNSFHHLPSRALFPVSACESSAPS